MIPASLAPPNTDKGEGTPKTKPKRTQAKREYSSRVYDAHTPVPPAWNGEKYHQGIRLIAGRDFVENAANELLNLHTPLGCDIETCGTGPHLSHQIKVVTVGTSNLVVALDPRDPTQRPIIRRLLSQAPELIFHNASFDIPLLIADGLTDVEVVERVTCTLVTSRLGLPGRVAHDLGSLAERFLNIPKSNIENVFGAAGYKNKADGFLYMDIDSATYLASAMLDTAVTATLAPLLLDYTVKHLTCDHGYMHFALDRDGALNEIQRQQIVNRVMMRSSVRGFVLDENYYEQYLDEQTQHLQAAERTLTEAGLTPGVSAQLMAKLVADGLLPATWPRTKTGLPCGDKDNLKKLRHIPLVDVHLTYAEINKNKKDYLDKLLEYARFDGRVHPDYKILGAGATGRMSAGNPPVQQFPDAARMMILADDPGGWVSIDWTAVEPMTAAYTSGQTDLASAVLGGADVYVPVARAAGLIPSSVSDADAKEHKGRKASKVVLLGLLYGKGVPLLASELGVTYDEAQDIKFKVLAGVPAIGAWMDMLKNAAQRFGTTITASGRVVPVERDYERGGYKGYLAQNYYHQGSSYDALADAIVEIHRQGLASHVRIAVHDELVVTTAAASAVEHIMRNSTVSLSRFLIRAGMPVERTSSLILPTDANALTDRWKKV